MSNATTDLRVSHIGEGGRKNHLPVAASTTIYRGTCVAQLASGGGLVPGSTASSGHCIGVSTHRAVNAGLIGAARCEVEFDRIFIMDNKSGDAFTDVSPIDSVVYMEDDHTGCVTAGSLFAMGKFRGLEADGRIRVYIDPSIVGHMAGLVNPA